MLTAEGSAAFEGKVLLTLIYYGSESTELELVCKDGKFEAGSSQVRFGSRARGSGAWPLRTLSMKASPPGAYSSDLFLFPHLTAQDFSVKSPYSYITQVKLRVVPSGTGAAAKWQCRSLDIALPGRIGCVQRSSVSGPMRPTYPLS